MWKNHVMAISCAVIATVAPYGAGLVFGWVQSINWLEAFSVFTSYWCTFLCVFQSRWNYPIGAISVAALCLLFYQSNLLSSMALQVYLFPTLLYGWFRWRPDAITRPVTMVEYKWMPVYAILTTVVGMVCMEVNTRLGGTNAAWDTAILVLSILAQFLLDNKKIENWGVWIVVDVISMFLYWEQGLKILAIQMGFFILNAIWGLFLWNRSMK